MSDIDQSQPFISEGLSRFLKRRLFELGGILVLGLGGLLGLALISARPEDPSAQTASGEAVQNILGPAGANVAAYTFGFFGLAAFLISLCVLIWGAKIIHNKSLPRWRLRLAGLLVSVFVTATGLQAFFPQPPVTSAGGVAGLFLFHKTMLLWEYVLLPRWLDSRMITGSVCLLAGSGLFVWSAGLGLRHFSRLAAVLVRPIRVLAASVTAVRGKAVGMKTETKQHIAAKTAVRTRKGTKSLRKEPVLLATAQAEEDTQAPAQTKSPARQQHAFDFDSNGRFRLPPLKLLKTPPKASAGPAEDMLNENAAALKQVLEDFRIQGDIEDVRYGPVVTRYGLNPAPGTKSQRVIALADDIARSMSALAVRVAVVPGQNVIGIELPNETREIVLLRHIFDHPSWAENDGSLPLALGKDIAGAPVIADLARMPHLLVAGTTGSGKSVGINGMILSLLYRYTPEECRLIMIDPKMLELSVYDGIPHLLTPVVTDPAKAVMALKWAVREMENRYRNMAKMGVRNIDGYNARLTEARQKGEMLTRRVQTGFDPETGKPVFEDEILDLAPLPFIVVVIDEVADLMMVAGKEIEAAVQRLAQMARAAGIHVIMATQRPSVDVITGTIKANFPTRISFQVTSRIDSRTILGEQGAEQLLGRGDMLFMEGGGRVVRVHGPFVDDREVEDVAAFLRQQGEPDYNESVTEETEADDSVAAGADAPAATGNSLYDEAVALVIREQKASTSFVQRHLKIGYNRAATLIEEMEAAGIISAANHVGKRDVLISNEE